MKKPKKQIRNFEKTFSKQTMEEINDIIRDHLIPTSMWDSRKILQYVLENYC